MSIDKLISVDQNEWQIDKLKLDETKKNEIKEVLISKWMNEWLWC